MPELASEVKPREDAMKQLKEVAATMCGLPDKDSDLEMLREGLVRKSRLDLEPLGLLLDSVSAP